MTHRLQAVMLLAVVLYFCILYALLKKRLLHLKYTLLWILSGALMLVLALFPRLLDGAARLLGVYEATNALFAMAFFCVIILLMALTAIVSKLNRKVSRLAQTIALLEKRVRDNEAEEGEHGRD